MLLFISYSGFSQTFDSDCNTSNAASNSESEGTPVFLCDEIGPLEYDIILNDFTFASSAFPGGLVIDENVLVNGILFVDVPTTIILSNFVMGENATIFVDTDVTLGAISSNFYSCDNMWEGFILESESSGVFYSNRIEDATHALTVNDGATFTLGSNLFNRNHIGLRNGSGFSGSSGMNPVGFYGNIFTSSSTLRGPRSSEYGFCGIQLTQCVASLGTEFSKNFINKTEFGIISIESDMIAQNFEITELRNTNNSVGIKTEEGIAHINGHGAVIANCGWAGIEAQGTSLEVENYNIRGIQAIGITSESNTGGEDIHIHDNNIQVLDDISTGIYLIRSATTGGSINKIDKNTVTVAAEKCIGIYSFGGLPSLGECEILENTVLLNEKESGAIVIDVGYGRMYSILQNNITFNFEGTSGNSNGILFGSAFENGHEISFNVIQGFKSQIQGTNGIEVADVRAVTLCSNIVNNSQRGLSFLGFNSPTFLVSNNMNHHNVGLLVDGSGPVMGAIGPQTRNSNLWLEDFNNSIYADFAAQCNADPDNSKFITENSSPNILPPLRTPGGTDWFEEISGSSNTCGGQGPGGDFGGAEDRIINEGIASVSGDPLEQWELLHRIYYGLLIDNAAQENEATTVFLDNNSTLSAAKFAILTNKVVEASIKNQTLLEELNQTLIQQKGYLNELAILDNSVPLSEELTDIDPEIAESKAVILNAMKELSDQTQAIEAQIKANLKSDLAALNAEFNALPENEIWEQNNKFMLGVMMKVLQSEELNEVEKNTVREIAHQCSVDGGTIVNTAKAYLPLCERIEVEQMNCDNVQERRQISDSVNEIKANIYPNPVTDVVNVSISEEGNYNIKIMDISGKTISNVKNYQDTQINIEHLENGLYFISISNGDTIVKTEKFVKL